MRTHRLRAMAVLPAILLAGCVSITYELPNGHTLRYTRLGNQQIGGMTVTLPEGPVIQFEAQTSQNDAFVQSVVSGAVAGAVKGVTP